MNESGGQARTKRLHVDRPELGLQVQAPSLGDWICNPVAGRRLQAALGVPTTFIHTPGRVLCQPRRGNSSMSAQGIARMARTETVCGSWLGAMQQAAGLSGMALKGGCRCPNGTVHSSPGRESRVLWASILRPEGMLHSLQSSLHEASLQDATARPHESRDSRPGLV